MPPGTVVRISNAQHVQNASRLSVLELRLRGGAGAPGQMPGQGRGTGKGQATHLPWGSRRAGARSQNQART